MTFKYLKTALGFTERVLFPYIITLLIIPGLSWYFFFLCSFPLGVIRDFEFSMWFMGERKPGSSFPASRGALQIWGSKMLLSAWVTPRFSSPTGSGYTFMWSGVKLQPGLIQAISQDATLPGEHEKLARAPSFCLHVPAPSNNLFSPLFLQLKMRELYYVVPQDLLPFEYSDFYDLELHC